nr:hypothetical protein [Tanacetum cinerariifolium]
MDITRDQQVALDDALVPPSNRLRIDKSNFQLRSDLKSKESTLHVVYDVLKLTPFYKAFLITADVPKIYIQEDDNQDDNEEQTDSDNDDDDFVHLKFSTHDDEDKEEESFDPRVQTPSHAETTDDEDNDEDSQGMNVKEDELDEEEVNEEDEANELYRDVNNNRMNKVVKVVVQLQSDRLRDEAQAENEDFLNKLDENIKKISRTKTNSKLRHKESAQDVYSKRRIIAVTELQIVEWHNYKHLDWINVRRDDDKLYKFKEGDFNRLRIQDIENMLLLLVQGKLTNLTVAEQLAFNVSLQMFTRSVVIQRRMEDLQLGYQKKINLTKPDTYRSDLERKEAYTAYSNPRERFYTSAGNPVKEILLKLNLSDHRILKDGGEAPVHVSRLSLSDEVLKLKNFKKDTLSKLFKLSNQERYEQVGPKVTSAQGGKDYKMAKRYYAWLMISRCSRSHPIQAKEQAQDQKFMFTTTNS